MIAKQRTATGKCENIIDKQQLDMLNKDKTMSNYKPRDLGTSFYLKLLYLKPAVGSSKLFT